MARLAPIATPGLQYRGDEPSSDGNRQNRFTRIPRRPLVDQAGWHLSARLVVPANITIIPLPPKSPELNPVENIWQYMRDNWLSNRVFKSYDDIVDHRCYAWNTLLDRPWKIMSIGLRQWAHEF